MPERKTRLPDGRSGEPASLARLSAQRRRVQHDAAALATGVEDTLEELAGLAREQLRARPYATLAAASGLGYLLGGGLPSPLVRLLVDQGSRLALGVAVSRWMGGGAPDDERSTT